MDGHIFSKSIKNILSSKMQISLQNHFIDFCSKEELNYFYDEQIKYAIEEYIFAQKVNKWSESTMKKKKRLIAKYKRIFLKKILLNIQEKDNTMTIHYQNDIIRLCNMKKYHQKEKKKVMNLLSNIDNLHIDVLFIVSTKHMHVPFQERVIGYVITHVAKCIDVENKYSSIPTIVSLNVNSNYTYDTLQKKGKNGSHYVEKLCVFMYLYSLKKKNYLYGLAELPGLYCNIRRLCLYNHFHFEENIAVKSSRCYKDEPIFPMIVKISSIKFTDLENFLEESNVSYWDNEPLCKGSIHSKQLQKRVYNYYKILQLKSDKISIDDISHNANKNKKTKKKYERKNKTFKKNQKMLSSDAVKYFADLSKQGYKLY